MSSPQIVFRTDASQEIGTGHVMRCLTLADELKVNGASVSFISRKLPGHHHDLIHKRGFETHAFESINDWKLDASLTAQFLKTPCDCLIVDHYALDKHWEKALRPHARKIMVIDDLANRPHDCDLLLDPNYFPSSENRYDQLIPHHCKKFLGPRYALLRPQFQEARPRLKKRDGQIRRVFIFFGGIDATNETEKALQALAPLKEIQIDVVLGAANPHREKIIQLVSDTPRIQTHSNVENMAELMIQADLALGAGGSTTWERCALGLPSFVIIIAENQVDITQALASAGIVVNLGWHHQVTTDNIAQAISSITPEQLKQMERLALELMPEKDNSIISAILESGYAKAR